MIRRSVLLRWALGLTGGASVLLWATLVAAQLMGSNAINLLPKNSGTSPQIAAAGADTNISLVAVPKGTGAVQLGTGGTAVNLTDANGNAWLAQTATGSAVNGVTLANAATGNAPTFSATGTDTNIGLTLSPKGTGAVTLGGIITTGVRFFPAVEFCKSDSANLIVTRVAAGDWALARTAAGAETYNIHCTLNFPWRSTASKGYRIDSFSIAQQITTATLTSNTFNALSTVTYANNVADAVASYGGTITITMPTAIQALPYLTAATVGTPAWMTTANADVNVDFTVVMQNTGVYRLYGIAVTYSDALY